MGRTLDYEFSYGEQITITPRNYRFSFRHAGDMDTHFAMIGMAHVEDNYPLYYDAVNEKGLGMAGLNFVGNAYYGKPQADRQNIAQFELIAWVLGQCADIRQARRLLDQIHIVDTPFSAQLPASGLHWIIADQSGALTVESMEDGLHIYDNPVGVLTNNPPFEKQMFMLQNYMHLSPKQPENLFSKSLPLQTYSRGMGALGLPGDLSSASRFVRAAFTKTNAISEPDENSSVGQFFHILGTVAQTRGCCEVDGGAYEITIYTSCWNAARGIYYYTTYTNRRITAVDMHRENLDKTQLICYPMRQEEQIAWENAPD